MEGETSKKEFASKEMLIWLPSVLILGLVIQGPGPLFNAEYLLGYLLTTLFSTVPGLLIGKLASLAKKDLKQKQKITYYTALGVNILFILILMIS